MMARPRMLSPDEYAEATKAFEMVFQSDDPRDAPFAPSITRRALWYPVSLGLHQDDRHILALNRAAQVVGDAAYFVSVLVRNPAASPDPRNRWLVPLSPPDKYRDLLFALNFETAHYSPEGIWGLMFSHEEHGVVGGSALFVDSFFQSLGIRDDDCVTAFLDRWLRDRERLEIPLDWIEPFLAHLYGLERARTWLAAAGLA